MATAQVRQLPTACSEPVQNPRWRGRYPRGVACFNHYRRKRPVTQVENAEADDLGDTPAANADAMPNLVFLMAGFSHAKGATLYDPNGDAVRIVEPYGPRWVRGADGKRSMFHGYVCEAVETGKRLFYRASDLFDVDGHITYLSAVSE